MCWRGWPLAAFKPACCQMHSALHSQNCLLTCGSHNSVQKGLVWQVAGVLVLDGETLRTLRVMAIDNIETPEGIAFSHGCTYIARCLPGCHAM